MSNILAANDNLDLVKNDLRYFPSGFCLMKETIINDSVDVQKPEIKKDEYRLKGVIKKFDLVIQAGEAKIGAPLSPTLGQFGLNCQDFCSKFNELSGQFEPGTPLRVRFYVLPERQFEFDILGPSLIRLKLNYFGLRRRFPLKYLKSGFFRFFLIFLLSIKKSEMSGRVVYEFFSVLRTLRFLRKILNTGAFSQQMQTIINNRKSMFQKD
jgi:hypothetical protein